MYAYSIVLVVINEFPNDKYWADDHHDKTQRAMKWAPILTLAVDIFDRFFQI